jgi:hypothetical protein
MTLMRLQKHPWPHHSNPVICTIKPIALQSNMHHESIWSAGNALHCRRTKDAGTGKAIFVVNGDTNERHMLTTSGDN